eukprot:12273096-Heterocapsa_arctica.AAC.1
MDPRLPELERLWVVRRVASKRTTRTPAEGLVAGDGDNVFAARRAFAHPQARQPASLHLRLQRGRRTTD